MGDLHVELETAGRIVSVVAGALTVVPIILMTRRLYGSCAARFAAISPGTFFLGQAFLFDMPLAAYALLADAIAIGALARGARVPWTAWSCAGLAVLMKGPVALLHTLPVIALTSVHFGSARALVPRGRWIVATSIVGLPLAAWAAAVVVNVEGGYELLVRQIAGRLSGSHGHQRPWYLYTWVVAVFALPWAFDLGRARNLITMTVKFSRSGHCFSRKMRHAPDLIPRFKLK